MNLSKISKQSLVVYCLFIIAIICLLSVILNQKVEYLSWDADNAYYGSLDELERDSNLIVIGTPLDTKNFLSVTKDNFINEGYTKTQFKVDQVLYADNGTVSTDEITLIEPYFVYEFNLQQKLLTQIDKQIIAYEEYTPMERNNKYVLFLSLNSSKDSYLINGIHQGQYNLSEFTSTPRSQFYDNNSDNHINGLRNSILNKYREEVVSYLR